MIDTHSHIFDEQFDDDRPEAIKRALEAGVENIILPAIDSTTHQKLIDTSLEYPGICIPAMGLHPTSVNDNPQWREELATIERYFDELPVSFCAVGEVGLDLYWSRDYLDHQLEALRFQIEIAIKADLPLIIHTREAWDEMFDLLRPFAGKIRGVFHSFSGTTEHWKTIRRLDNLRVGIGGVITYKKSYLKNIVREIPLEFILLETDSPYLPPVPYRGKRNESSYLPIIAHAIAEAKNITAEDVSSATTSTARRLFNL